MNPVDISNSPEDVQKTFSRVTDLFGTATVPEPFLVYANVEPFLKDFYMNFKKFVYGDGANDAKTRAIIAFAASIHGKSATWTSYFRERCLTLGVTDQQVGEIVAVVSTNYMYNTFFKFRHISGTDRFDGMSVGLRASSFTNTSLDETTLELINIAISDLNACQPCTTAHVNKALKLELSNEAILESIQCAATIYAGCMFLNASSS